MAKLLYANDGSVDLMPDTLAALRALPSHWHVILNARPAGDHHTREIDALIVTERALHLVEFKYREGVAEILGDGPWCFGGWPEKVSPAIQAVETADAFKTWLAADRDLCSLKNAVLPWVVLERFDAEHRFGQTHMRADRYYDPGFAKVINGVKRLQDILLRLEKAKKKVLPWNGISLDQGVPLLIQRMGARPLDTLTIQGQVQNLTDGSPLAGLQVRVRSQKTEGPLAGFSRDIETDALGRFAVHGAPVAAFEVEIDGASAFPGWLTLPNAPVQPRTSFALVNLYLVQPGLAEAEVRTLLSEAVDQVKSDIGDLQSWLLHQDEHRQDHERRLQQLEQKANEHPESAELDLTEVWAEIDALRADQHRCALLEEADVHGMVQGALAPLQEELKSLAARLSHLEGQVAATAQDVAMAQRTASAAFTKAETSADQAQRASTASRQAAAEAERSRMVQQQRLNHERTVHHVAEERQARRAEALKLSAIVGASGGILSMQPLPFADNVLLAPMQIWLVIRIGQVYGQRVGQDAAIKLLGTLGFGFAAQHATVALYKLVPGLTFGLGPFTVFGFTVLLGAMTALFYERGTMPGKAEQKAVMNGIRTLLRNPALAAEIREIGKAVATEFRAQGFKTRPEDLQALFGRVAEQARPIGEHLERELFRPAGTKGREGGERRP